MRSLCMLFTTVLVVATASTLTGCYDLSDPSGPHRDDFVQDTKGTPAEPAPATEQKTTADVRCPTSPCNADDDTERLLEAAQTREAKVPNAVTDEERVEDARRKLRVQSSGDSPDLP
jgi:hypothetical protein